MANKLGELNEKQIRNIIAYRESHSLRETAAYIKQYYGIDVSYVTIKRYLEVNWKQLSKTELKLLNAIYNSAFDIIDEYRALLAGMGNNKKGKIVVLDKYARFVSDMFKNIDKENHTVKETKQIDTKQELDWQKELATKE